MKGLHRGEKEADLMPVMCVCPIVEYDSDSDKEDDIE